jgi:hypothetical protein
MKYLILMMLSFGATADLPIVEQCSTSGSYKAFDQHGNVIVVSCTVLRVVELRSDKG